MDITTTDLAGEFFKPGDTITDTRAVVHEVFKVFHTGYGKAGTLLTHRMGRSYAVWLVAADGAVRPTISNADFPYAASAFGNRVMDSLKAEV